MIQSRVASGVGGTTATEPDDNHHGPTVEWNQVNSVSGSRSRLSYVNSECEYTGWNFKNKECDPGYGEMYEERFGQQSQKLCCNTTDEHYDDYKKSASACRATKCGSGANANLCSTMHDRYVEGSKLDMEEILRDPCELEDGGAGAVGLCCVRNSTEGLLATMMGAEPGQFPHQAKLKLPGSCGGTVYNKRFIVTAAHCIVGTKTKMLDPVDGMTVILGTNNADVDEADERYVYKVKKAIPHPKYSGLIPHLDPQKRIFNDIALLELDRDIQFGPKVKALEIAPKGFKPLEYAPNAVIVGWGTTDTLDLSSHLKKANFVIRSDDACFKEGPHWEMSEMPDQLLCVGGILEGKWSPTAGGGDSGGPAICRGQDGRAVLCGVTSYGGSDEDCLNNNDEDSCIPSVYAEVAYFHDWIKKNAGPQDPSTFYKPYLYGEPVPRGKYEHQVHITSQDGKPMVAPSSPEILSSQQRNA